jgi:MFS superfamily sulfate permease-like transporter
MNADAQTVPSIDVTAATMLEELAADLARGGRPLHLARNVGQVRDVLRRAGAGDTTWDFYPSVRLAVAAATSVRA